MRNDKQKSIVVAVSGGFDPLHIGHVRLFQEAKKLGDKLIVILNNDNWLMAKKGYVFMQESERKEVLGSLSSVDEVVLTKHAKNPKDMSVCRELLGLQPNIFANGGDRYKHNIPEVAVCNTIGCRMVFNVGAGGKVQSSSWLLNNHKKLAKLDEQAKLLSAKKIVMFDLDGTLTESKANLDRGMAVLLCQLLEKKIVAVIGGGNYPQFEKQFLAYLQCKESLLKNLFILPTSGGRLYKHSAKKWRLVYKNALATKGKRQILNAFQKVFRDINYTKPEKTYGRVIEDRESQMTFSALGQKAPLAKKEEWNKKQDIRPQLRSALEKYLPEFEVRLGGLSSIDITKKGIDKAYGIKEIAKLLSASIQEMVYIGDALFEGGNDFAVIPTGIDTIQVSGPADVKYLISQFLKK